MTTNEKTALVLRTCAPSMTSYRGSFRWPRSGLVAAPDWDPRPVDGGGLHGLLWGEGDGSLLDWHADAVWLVMEVEVADLVALGPKVKFPRGTVVYAGGRARAIDYLAARAPRGVAIVGATVTVGDHGTAIVGDRGHATAGDGGTATAGNHGTATVGYRGTATAHDGGTASAGDHGTAIVGDSGTATAGYRGTAMVVGLGGTATAGICGTAAAGEGGTAAAGEGGTLLLRWWDGVRYRTTTLYVGEDGIQAGQPYRVDARGRAVRVRQKDRP
jgi:hypothetical protein